VSARVKIRRFSCRLDDRANRHAFHPLRCRLFRWASLIVGVFGTEPPARVGACTRCGRTLENGAHHPLIPPPYCWFNTDYCPDGAEHVWGETHYDDVLSGPMEGRWAWGECVRCGVGGTTSLDSPGQELDSFLAAFEAARQTKTTTGSELS
jgi:hypothetical protein